MCVGGDGASFWMVEVAHHAQWDLDMAFFFFFFLSPRETSFHRSTQHDLAHHNSVIIIADGGFFFSPTPFSLPPCLPPPPCSIDKVSKVSSPVLVIHGTEDEVIDFSHGLAIYERCPRAVEPLWVEGAGHNDVELYNQVRSGTRPAKGA